LSCTNIPQFPIIYYGILKAGAVVVPMNVLLKAREIAYHLTDSSAKAYFCFGAAPACTGRGRPGRFRPGARVHPLLPVTTALEGFLADASPVFESVPVSATDTAVILYTSGTTGTPKGAELTHANMVLNALTCHRLFGTVDDEVHLVALPLFHSFGQTVQLNSGFGAGATLVLLPRFTPAAALATMASERVTFFAGVPTMYWALAGAADTVDVKAIAGTCESPSRAVPRYRSKSTNRSGAATASRSARATACPRRARSPRSTTRPVGETGFDRPAGLGRPRQTGRQGLGEVPDGEAGEIAVRGHNVMKGLLDRPEATEQVIRDGWFRTGDIATRDEDGYYFVVDRAKDMIVRGGFNVYPRELEEVIMTHPAVSLVAVVGVPHESHAEEVKAFVIKNADAVLTESELIAWCRANMAGYKYRESSNSAPHFP